MERHHRKHSWNRGILVFLFFGAILASGCLTQKKREDITHRYLRENPKTLADLAAVHFPVVVRPGIPTIIRDTIVRLERDIEVVDSIVYITETKWNTITIKERIVDTIPDGALVESLMQAKFMAENDLQKTRIEYDIEKTRSSYRLRWLLAIAACLTLVLGLNAYSFFKPKIRL